MLNTHLLFINKALSRSGPACLDTHGAYAIEIVGYHQSKELK